MYINLTNDMGHIIRTKIGFSWTVFFFNFFVPLSRKDWKWFFIMLGLSVFFAYFLTDIAFVVGIIMSFIYNQTYINELIDKGYRPLTDTDKTVLKTKGLLNKTLKD